MRERYPTFYDRINTAVTLPVRFIGERVRRRMASSGGHLEKKSEKTGHGPLNNGFVWALKDVSFDIKHGEVVGVIGKNGAGKSTLLKTLSRITEPTEGRAEIHGRVGSLLEVGTGFHPELTGRENIFLNGAILGMKKAEIVRKLDDIVAFAEIERFIDTPVKHYSSGMYVRLAFSVAAHLDPDILLVDEVLAVGDFSFQEKCLSKMDVFSRQGKTVLLVTHNMAVVARICQKVLLFESGRIRSCGEPRAIIDEYLHKNMSSSSSWRRLDSADHWEGIAITEVKVCDEDGRERFEVPADRPLYVHITYEVKGGNVRSRIVLQIEADGGQTLFSTTDCDINEGVDKVRRPGVYETRCRIPGHLLAPGKYYASPSASWTNVKAWDSVPRALSFNVSKVGSVYILDKRPGFFAPILDWETKTCPAGA